MSRETGGGAVRINMRGVVLNSAGVYNRCKLTRLVIDSDWDKKVWNDSWKAKEEARKEDEELSEAAIKTLAPNPEQKKEVVDKSRSA